MVHLVPKLGELDKLVPAAINSELRATFAPIGSAVNFDDLVMEFSEICPDSSLTTAGAREQLIELKTAFFKMAFMVW